MLHRELLVNGYLIGGPCDNSVPKIIIRSPFDGSVIGTAAEALRSDAMVAVETSAVAFEKWRRSTRLDRQRLLRSIAGVVRARESELAELLTLEVGKPISWAKGEVDRLAITFDLAGDLVSQYGGQWIPVDFDERGDGYRCVAERVPVGPVLAIVPYNWPYNLAAHKIAPALAVGCTVVLKASHQAPLSTLSLARLINEAGCPPGVVNAVYCEPEVAEAMALDSRIKMISFTGSPSVGWRLKKVAAEKRVSLELGGDATAIVCADGDLDFAVQRCVAGGYGYAGQICIAVQHVTVESSVYDKFKDSMVKATLACPSGDPKDPTTVCGPMISSEAVDKVMSWIDEAVSAGARLLAGGTRAGNVIAPTLLEDVPFSTKLGHEEVFGPVLTLSRFETLDEAIATVNASSYGIQCGLFTHDIRLVEKAFREIDTGGLIVGDYPTLRFDNLPYGGIKKSGFGREGVQFAMDEMTEWKTLLIRGR
jgi:acyl-CoA reductase-like NAD-dependent aldehyde dehydrogenase